MDTDVLLSKRGASSRLIIFAALVVGGVITLFAPTLASASSLAWHPTTLIDHQAPYADAADPAGVSCPSTGFCAAVDSFGNVITSSTPTAGISSWHVKPVGVSGGDNPFTGISCPTTSLCVAVDDDGFITSSTNPSSASSTWTSASFNGPEATGFEGISCSSATLCVATEGENVFATTNPTGPASAWTAAKVDPGNFLSNISCTADLCVAIDNEGNVLTSTNPTGGASAWHLATISAGHNLDGVSCPTEALCVVTEGGKNLFTATNPSGGAGAWTATELDRGNAAILNAVSCSSVTLCVASDSFGRFLAATNPTGNEAAWKVAVTNTTDDLLTLSCAPGSATCVSFARSGWGNALAITGEATSSGDSWTIAALNSDGSDGLSDLSCPSEGLCVAVDMSGNAATSTSPASGAWSLAHIDSSFGEIGLIYGVSCPTTKLCVAVDGLGDVVTSTSPTGGAAAWHLVKVDINNNLHSVSCSSEVLCVAADTFGNVVTSTNPTAGAGAWTTTKLTTNELTATSCANSGLCATTDSFGHLYASSSPTGGAGDWTTSDLSELKDVSCAASFCVAARGGFGFAVSTAPTGGTATWHATVPAGLLQATEVSCLSTSFCVGVGVGEEEESLVRRAYISTNPTASTPTWTEAETSDAESTFKIDCVSTRFCAALSIGGVVTATPTIGGATKNEEPTTKDETKGKEETKVDPSGGTTSSGGTGTTTTTAGGATSGGSTATISSGAISSRLLQQLSPSGKAATIKSLLSSGGLTMSFTSLVPGSLVIDWYDLPRGAKITATKAKPILVASAIANFSTATTTRVKIKLTSAGKKLLRHASNLMLTGKASFTPTAKAAVTISKTFVLKRQ